MPADAVEQIERWRRQPSPAEVSILAGDSIAKRFPSQLLPHTSGPWLQRGRGGEQIDELATRIDEVLDRRPRLLVLQSGTNDVLRGRSLEEIEHSYDQLLTVCLSRDRAGRIVICSIPPVAGWRADPETVLAVNQKLSRAAQARGVEFLGTFSRWSREGAARPGVLKRDGVHLCPVAYEQMATDLRLALCPAGDRHADRPS